MIPIATLRLGPHDYGAFALVTAFTAVGTSIAILGSGYRLAEVFARADPGEERQIVTTQLVVSIVILIVVALVLAWAGALGRRHWPPLADVPAGGVELGALSMLGSGLWVLTTEVLTVTRRARMFAFGMFAQSLATAAVLPVALFGFEAGSLALFIAAFAASLVALLFSLLALRPYLTRSVAWGARLREVCTGAMLMSVANTSEAGYQAIERTLLSASATLSQLGLYVHALQYRALVALSVKAGARSVWRDSLAEARAENGSFQQTRTVWSACYGVLVLCGLAFAAVGRELIGILSHGKFVAAAPYTVAGIAILLTQHMGKPQTAVLYARGHGSAYARITVGSLLAATVAASLLIPMYGVWGALGAGLTQTLIMRVGIHWLAKRVAAAPVQDRMAWWGLGVLMTHVTLDACLQLSLPWRFALSAILASLFVLAVRRDLVELRALWKSASP